MREDKPVPIAIVGVSCRFPGAANSPQSLWNILKTGSNTWSHVPAHRYTEKAFLHPDPNDANGTHNHAGGHFLDQDIRDFDNEFFNISSQEAAAMDPQQRILLEVVYEALEDAGRPLSEVRGSNTSVYVAMFSHDYERNIYKDTLDIPRYHVVGNGEAILSNRISHVFDLNGPSMTLDTGCSGGLVAVHQACQSLALGESDMAIAGASNLILSPDHQISMSNLHMLSADGRSYPFDKRGSGYGRGEGFAALILKRLDDAVASGDSIRAVLLGSAVNQDGHTAGITRPSRAAQAALERLVFQQLGLNPHDVGYVEAHGTGTAAGDREEIEALAEVFCEHRNLPLYVGSIKSNIGHLESTSGLAGLIKGLLILEHNQIPPNADFQQEKEELQLHNRRIQVPTALEPWPLPGVPKISVNSFGYGGTNAHVVLEGRSVARHRSMQGVELERNTPRLFVFSAKSQSSLRGTIGEYVKWMAHAQHTPDLASLSYTLCRRRTRFSWHYACVATTLRGLKEQLDRVISGTDTLSRPLADFSISFVFTGQGSQWPGMAQELLLAEKRSMFKDSIDRSRAILLHFGARWDLVNELLRKGEDSQLHKAEIAQPATTSVQVALVDFLRSMGVRPSAVVGHSSGEIAAAYAAGYISQYTALKVSYWRGVASNTIKTKSPLNGAMLAVGLGEQEVSPYIDHLTKGIVSVACVNSPTSTTISGDEDAIKELAGLLSSKNIFNRKLQVDTAYHSHHMHAAADEYCRLMGQLEIELEPYPIKFFSTVTGCEKTDGFDADYWVSNLVSKVRFADGVQQLYGAPTPNLQASKHHIFIEIGPHNTLAGPTRQCIAGMAGPLQYDYISPLRRGTDAVQSLLEASGKLIELGQNLNSSVLSCLDAAAENAVVLHNLPSYKWDHSKKHWHESHLSRNYRLRRHPYHDLLGVRVPDSTPIEPRWRYMIGLGHLPWLADHVVDGMAVFPGSGYLCMAIEAISQVARDNCPEQKLRQIILRDVDFLKALLVPDAPHRTELHLSFALEDTRKTSNRICFRFRITAFPRAEMWNEHCRGTVEAIFTDDKSEPAIGGIQSRRLELVGAKTVSSEDIYLQLRKQGNLYGPKFSGIQEISIDDQRAIATVVIPDVAEIMPAMYMEPHIIHPTTLDILLHTSLPLAAQKLDPGSTMPVHISEVVVSPNIGNTLGTTLSVSSDLTFAQLRCAQVNLVVSSENDSMPVLSVSGLELRSLAGGSSGVATHDARDICFEMRWCPDVDFLSSENLVPSQDELGWHEVVNDSKLAILNQAASVYIEKCLALLQTEEVPVTEQHHRMLIDWMVRHNQSFDQDSKVNHAFGEGALLGLLHQQGVEGEFLGRLGPQLPEIVSGKANTLEIMLEDDLLYRVYKDDSSAKCYNLMSRYTKHLCFKKSNFSVLEIGAGTGGATLPLLEAMKAEGCLPSVYDFTDISSGFFDRAASLLQGYPVTFRELDIEKAPAEQGFERSSYDVVLASNVLHATSNIKTTLKRVRSLLKPDGRLILVEVVNPQPYLNIMFGTLPGWWKGFDDGRTDGPFLTVDGWREALKSAAMEMQVVADDDDESAHISSVMIAKPADEASSISNSTVQLLFEYGRPNLESFAARISNALKARGIDISIHDIHENLLDQFCIKVILDDGSSPILSRLTSETFQTIREMLRVNSRILWLSATDEPSSLHNPKKHLITGLARSAHAENDGLRMITVDVQERFSDAMPQLLEWMTRGLHALFSHSQSIREREYVYRESKILIPRLMPSKILNEWISPGNAKLDTELRKLENQALKLITDSSEESMKLTYTMDEEQSSAICKDAVEIQVKAVGVPTRGLQSNIQEYAGTISAIGSTVADLSIGDHVIAVGKQPFQSRPRLNARNVRRMPSQLSFATAAAIPSALMTACYAFFDVADLQPGQTMLIRGMSTAVGQALLLVGQKVRTTVITLIAEQSERYLLKEQFHIPTEYIIDEDALLYRPATMSFRGLDAIFNCADSEIPARVTARLNPFASIVCLNQGNSDARNSVHSTKLPANATLHNCDIEALLEAKPQKAAALLKQAVALVDSGLPVQKLMFTTRNISDIRDASELRDPGGFGRKLVLQVDETSVVAVANTLRRTFDLSPNAAFVVAGGLGDLGKRLLFQMAKHGAKHLVALTRSAPNRTFHRLQDDLTAVSEGCKLYHVQCDISRESDMQRLVPRLSAMGVPRIGGVIHSAVVLQDRTLDSMTLDDFEVPLETKLKGTENLKRAFSEVDLEFFIMLSSAVNVVGSNGQGNYNAGNSVQDAVAQWPETKNCHYLSICPGVIEGTDVVRDNEVRLSALRRSGLKPIREEELDKVFEYALSDEARSSRLRQIVVGFDAESLSHAVAHNGNTHSATFTHVMHAAKAEIKQESGSTKRLFSDILIEANRPEDTIHYIATAVGEKLSSLVSLGSEEFDLTRPILDFGIDSLIAIELRNWIAREFQAQFQALEILDQQNVVALAKDISSRSALVRAAFTEDSNSEDFTGHATPVTPFEDDINIFSKVRLPSLPIPDLESTLQLLLESRKAVSSPEELETDMRSIQDFREKLGPVLQERLQSSGAEALTNSHEELVYLSRREPLQSYSTFFFGHLVDSPQHTQAERAAIITIAAYEFKQKLFAGMIERDSLNGEPVCTESLQWLFHTTRLPCRDRDVMKKYPSNGNIIVLRHGHIFQLSLSGPDGQVEFGAVKDAFEQIILASEEPVPATATLTTGHREFWAAHRQKLMETHPDNAAALDTIDAAAFIICLDDGSPASASDRFSQFLFNNHRFDNRWLDKPVQFVIAENATSAGVFEHTKLDAINVRQLHEHVTRAIFEARAGRTEIETEVGYQQNQTQIHELALKIAVPVIDRISSMQQIWLGGYPSVECAHAVIPDLGHTFLQKCRCPVKAVALLIILLAVRNFQQVVRPVWEIGSLAHFRHGRIDWAQTVTPPVRAFIDAVSNTQYTNAENTQSLRWLLHAAANSHTQLMARVKGGQGFVQHLYALLGAMTPEEAESAPSLFQSAAWAATKRGGPDQDVKTDYFPALPGEYGRWQEAGYMMHGEDSVFVHYGVESDRVVFDICTRPGRAERFVEEIKSAGRLVRKLLEEN